jgi:retron-type reverse transcriptase
MLIAYKRVVGNKGAAGVDAMGVDELKPYLQDHWQRIKEHLLQGKYKPQPVLRVQIPKPAGKGVRKLGIPTVVDHLILQAGVMETGLVSQPTMGTPQGGPLSPLLSNILLDDLDKELDRRGHRFCRYADDVNVYIGSKRAGERVLDSIERFLARRLKLQVNRDKSAVDRPWKRPYTRAKGLMKRGLGVKRAWRSATNGRGPWWNLGAPHMNQAFTKKFFDRLGLVSLLDTVLKFQCNS